MRFNICSPHLHGRCRPAGNGLLKTLLEHSSMLENPGIFYTYSKRFTNLGIRGGIISVGR